MKKSKDLSKYLKNSTLQSMYKQREESLYEYDEDYRKELEKIDKDYPVTFDILLEAVNQLPSLFTYTREDIAKKLNNYADRSNLVGLYENEKFYKSGFCDGAKLILEILQKR